MTGQTVLQYEILDKLGEGGMGIVYKARDTKLNRFVALKFLPAHLDASQDEKERFVQEAKAASAINHPNICTIHDIQEHDGRLFIVMEYVEGKTLRERMHGLSARAAIDIGIQVAEGLAAAHEKGIVHRDIKPENVIVRKDGIALIMDFGLAKLHGVSRLTRERSTVGTVGYMSPEQIQGEDVDYRSDIFSLGVLLYEMIAGRPPFKGVHETALTYEIVNVDPEPLAAVRPDIDPAVDRLVQNCLDKDPRERMQSARQVALDLKRTRRETKGKAASQSDVRPGAGLPAGPAGATTKEAAGLRRRDYILGMIALILLGTIVVQLLSSRAGAPHDWTGTLRKLTSAPGLEDEPAWSPDGKFIAYTSNERGKLDIIVQPIPSGMPIRVTEADPAADDAQPAWSPDGTKLAFVSARDKDGRLSIPLGQGVLGEYLYGKGGSVYIMPALGGPAVKLIDDGYYPSWSPDGKQIVFQSERGGQWDLWAIAAVGGMPRQLTQSDEFEFQPSWSPDGGWILCGAGGSIALVPAGGGSMRYLALPVGLILRPCFAPDGKSILYSSDAGGMINLWSVPISLSSGEVTGPPTQITRGEGSDISASVSPAAAAFATVKITPGVWECDVATRSLRQVSTSTVPEDYPSASPDGKTILVGTPNGSTPSLALITTSGKRVLQFPDEGDFARWAPDGRRFVYSTGSFRGIGASIHVRTLGDVSVATIFHSDSGAAFPAWSPDGRLIAFSVGVTDRQNIWTYDVGSGHMEQITHANARSWMPSFSPDSRMIVFNNSTGNTRHIWICDIKNGTPRQLSSGNDEYSHPQWSPKDMDVILFLRNHKNVCLMSVKTGRISQLTNFTDATTNLDYPSWSSDGRKIYFSLTQRVGDIFVLDRK